MIAALRSTDLNLLAKQMEVGRAPLFTVGDLKFKGERGYPLCLETELDRLLLSTCFFHHNFASGTESYL